MNSDHARAERQRFLRPPVLVVLTQEEFFHWLVITFGFGALFGILVSSMLGWAI